MPNTLAPVSPFSLGPGGSRFELLVAEYYVFETRKSLVKWLSKNLAIPSGFVGIMKEHIKRK
jgi:ribosome maturation protein Sdo1